MLLTNYKHTQPTLGLSVTFVFTIEYIHTYIYTHIHIHTGITYECLFQHYVKIIGELLTKPVTKLYLSFSFTCSKSFIFHIQTLKGFRITINKIVASACFFPR